MKLPSQAGRTSRQHGENGYVLLALLLLMALIGIAAAVILPSIKFNLERDREEEMIHRGVQYSRAIRTFYRKFGRYPVKIEDLENTNNIRFLRKRYKDPLSCSKGKCEDFKLLHFGEVQMAMSGFGSSSIPGATPVSAMGGSGGSAALGQSLAFGQSGASAFGGTSSFGSSSGSFNSSSSFGQSQAGSQGTDSSQVGSQSPDSSGANSPGGNSSSSNQLGSGQIIGGPIVGVASTSKAKTIREFNHKKQYKDWLFVYDPSQDVGFLITTPYQPQMPGIGMAGTPNLNGQSGTNSNSGFGSSSGFGNSFGSFGNSSGSQNNQNSGFGNSNQQNSSSPQQQ